MKVDTQRLKGEIISNSLTQEEFAMKIGVDKATISRYLNSAKAKIPIGIAHKMAVELKLSPEKACAIFFAH